MSPFISKAVNSCARDSLLSGLMLTVRLFKREGEEASLQCFTFTVQIGTGQRRCGDVQAGGRMGGLISSSVEILGTLLVSVTSMRLPFLQQTLKQERYPLTTVCCEFSLLAKCLLQVMGWGKPLQPTSDAPTSDTPRNRLQEISHCCCQQTDGLPLPPARCPAWACSGPAPAAGRLPCDPL